MKAIARMIWIYLTAYRLQRYITLSCLVLSLPCLVIALVFMALSNQRAAVIALFPILLCMVLISVPALLATGAVFRAFSSAKASLLIPWFRIKMLQSLFVTCGLITVVYSALLIGPAMQAGNVSPAIVVVGVFAVVSTLVYFVFRLMSATPWLLLELAAILLLAALLNDREAAAGYMSLAVVSLAVIGAWTVFGRWYLSGGRIRPIGLTDQHRWRFDRQRVPTFPAPWPATMTLVTMRYPVPLWAELLGVVVIAAAIGSVLLLLRQFGGNRSFPVEVALVIGSVVGSIIFIEFIRRSRLLWLLLGSRLQIFRTMERIIARVFLRVGLSLAVFASVLHLLVEPIPAARIAGIAAIFVGLTPLMLYIGMVSIRGIRWLEAGLLLLAFGSGLVLVIQVLRPAYDLGTTVVIVGIQLSIAVALRYFARHRWITIDWMAFKPQPDTLRDAWRMGNE